MSLFSFYSICFLHCPTAIQSFHPYLRKDEDKKAHTHTYDPTNWFRFFWWIVYFIEMSNFIIVSVFAFGCYLDAAMAAATAAAQMNWRLWSKIMLKHTSGNREKKSHEENPQMSLGKTVLVLSLPSLSPPMCVSE